MAVSGQLTAANVDAFRDQLAVWHASEEGVVNFVIDMSGCDFLDSAGLGTLIATLKRITERGGDMKIAALQKKPRMVFEITRAYKIFEIFDTVDDAVQSYQG
jgi:anti-sigma B factor antagonist